MAVPMAILDAARLGDRETVVAWLDSPGANRRMPRKEVLRLRSLVLRGRAPPHSTSHSTRGDDPVVARVLRLPDELAWKVLGFWRATSDITGEVI